MKEVKNLELFKEFKKKSKQVWSKLSQTEKETYYMTNGTIGFIEDVAEKLKIDMSKEFGPLPFRETEYTWFDELLDNLEDEEPNRTREYLVHLNIQLERDLTEKEVDQIEMVVQALLGNHADSVSVADWEEV